MPFRYNGGRNNQRKLKEVNKEVRKLLHQRMSDFVENGFEVGVCFVGVYSKKRV